MTLGKFYSKKDTPLFIKIFNTFILFEKGFTKRHANLNEKHILEKTALENRIKDLDSKIELANVKSTEISDNLGRVLDEEKNLDKILEAKKVLFL